MGTLLIVDDDPAVCCTLERSLAAYGHTVLAACDSPSALAICRAADVDHALVDFCLPDPLGIDRSGVDVARKIMSERRNIHLALLTGWPERAKAGAQDLGVEIIEKPATTAQLLEWIEEVEFPQREPCSGRREIVPLRKVLYVATSIQAALPDDVSGRIVTRTDDAYDELHHTYDLVVIDGTHPAMERLTAAAIEHGCCVYVVSPDREVQRRAQSAGACVLGPNELAALARLPLRKPSMSVPVLPWVQAKALEIITTPMPHEEKMQTLERLLLEDAAARYGSDRQAAAAVGLARATFNRHITPQPTTSPDAERALPMSKHGHPPKR